MDKPVKKKNPIYVHNTQPAPKKKKKAPAMHEIKKFIMKMDPNNYPGLKTAINLCKKGKFQYLTQNVELYFLVLEALN